MSPKVLDPNLTRLIRLLRTEESANNSEQVLLLQILSNYRHEASSTLSSHTKPKADSARAAALPTTTEQLS